VLALAGQPNQEVRTSDDALRWTSVSPRAALVWLSLDGLPAGQSRHWMAKMVTGAWNTGERTQPHYHTDHVNLYELLEPGTAPITTGGKPSDAPTVLTLGGQAVLRLWLRGGTWELEEDAGKRRLYCDTPGVQFEFPDASGPPLADVVGLDPAPLSGPPWVFPEQAQWVEAPVKN